MLEDSIYESAQTIRNDLTTLFKRQIAESMASVRIDMDPEIEQEIRERVAVLMFDEMVNDMPMVPYLAVWEEGAKEIAHAYMSPKIETFCGYTPKELLQIGYDSIVRGSIISYYRERDKIQERVSCIDDVQQKRVSGFLENKNWEGCYKIRKKNGHEAWVIDRSTITRFRNTKKENIICLSGGILLESTELFQRKEKESK